MKKFQFLPRQKLFIVLLVIFWTVAFLDLSNLDRYLHKGICSTLDLVFETSCPDFYDLPIWEVAVSFGTLAVVYFAYAAIDQSNRQMEVEQTPYVTMKDRIVATGEGRLHVISLKNVGRGMAVNLRATADPDGKISMIEGSNPYSIDLGSGEYNNSWAIDEGQVIKGLQAQGKTVQNSVINEIPDEAGLQEEEKDKSEFSLYYWYEDQIGHKYKTETKIRHSGHFLKVMVNGVSRIS